MKKGRPKPPVCESHLRLADQNLMFTPAASALLVSDV